MTLSPRTLLTCAISEDEPLTIAQCSYFRARFRSRIHEAMLRIFLDEKSKGLTKATLARRLGKAPEQITRWLASPGNLRLDTVSDILLAMRHELSFDVTPIELGVRRNEFHELASLKPTVAGNQENATITIRRASQSVEALHAN